MRNRRAVQGGRTSVHAQSALQVSRRRAEPRRPSFLRRGCRRSRKSCIRRRVYLCSDLVASLQNLIKDMIALNPSARPTFDTLLHGARGAVFPEVFYSFLHGYVWSINELPITAPFAPVPATGTSPEILTP